MHPTAHAFPTFNGEPMTYDPRGAIGALIHRERHGRGAVTASELRETVDRAGSYFFSPRTMRVWRSRLLGYAAIVPYAVRIHQGEDAEPVTTWAAGIGFITSERGWDGSRRYSVRVAIDAPEHPHGVSIDHHGEPLGYETSAEARVVLLGLADSVSDPFQIARSLAAAREGLAAARK